MHFSAPRPSQGHAIRARSPAWWAAVLLAAGLGIGDLLAVVPTELPSELAARVFQDSALQVNPALIRGTEVGGLAGGPAELGAPAASAYLDLRSGRWARVLPAVPLIPGDGVGNELTWGGMGLAAPGSEAELEAAVRGALVAWIGRHAGVLGIDPGELAVPSVAVHDRGALVQVSGGRVIDGIPVRDARFTAVVGHGNLVLFGTRSWGDGAVETAPAVGSAGAEAAVARYLGGLASGGWWRQPSLELVPVAVGGDGFAAGEGLGYRLVWVVGPELRAGLPGAWEALVDAATGEVLAFADTHVALAAGGPVVRNVVGGHLPVTNDGVPPGGVEEAGAPVPFADLEAGGETLFADGGGNFPQCVIGTVTSTLDGLLATITDGCGEISESTADPTLDFGTSPGTDCDTAPGASPGNTRAARTAYYELSRIKETALGHLPGNVWLAGQIEGITNIPNSCGAFWNGTSVVFYRSNGGPCANTGELAAVISHEWGHGLDDNGVNPSISNPSEGIADVYSALRLHDSCIGTGFFTGGGTCNGYGDPCVSCTGVRDIDWANRASGAPHDLAWIDAHCPGSGGPCGAGIHCESAAVSEALWDLYRRDLQGFDGSAWDFEDDTAAEIASRLTFLGAGPVGGWYDCIAGSAGCAADAGYMNFLAADDDDGDLDNGTPHMSAIFAAFDRLGIACPTPAVADSGCAGTPTAPPVVSAAPLDRGVHLTWGAVAGASGYAVYRTEGPLGCDFQKVPLGTTADTEWIDTGLQNGRTYRYVVIPKGPADSCFGNGSACTPAVPAPGAGLGPGAIDLTLLGSIILTGDGDPFIDNCEAVGIEVEIANLGPGAATGVEIVEVASPSHPSTVVVDPLPIAIPGGLAECTAAVAGFEIQAHGLAHDDTLVVEVTVDSAELPAPVVHTLEFPGTETDPPGVPDAQSEVCPLFADGFEGGDVSRWTDSVP